MEQAAEFVRAAALRDLQQRRRMRVAVAGEDVVLFLAGTEVFAVLNLCPHQRFADLHNGSFSGGEVSCPHHGWTFNVRTGEAVTGQGRLQTFETQIRNGDVWVRMPV